MGLLGLIWELGVLQPAFADGAADHQESAELSEVVRIQVWSVHALRDGSDVDEGLRDMAQHLAGLQYGTFRLLKKDMVALPVRGAKRLELAGGLNVRVTILERNAQRARVRVQMYSDSGVVLDTTVAIRRDGFFIVAGPRYEGGMLVLPIFARY